MASPSEMQRLDICGIPIVLCVDFDRSTINYGALRESFVQHRASSDGSKISTLVPSDAEIVTLVTTETDTFVLFPDKSSSNLFMTRPSFAAHHALGNDSVVHGWLYKDRKQRTHVAVFDASRILGKDLRACGALQRHMAVHQQLHAYSGQSSIHYHWCGHEAQCMRPFHTFKLDFDVSCIARLLEDMAVAEPEVLRVLPCLLTGDNDLRHA